MKRLAAAFLFLAFGPGAASAEEAKPYLPQKPSYRIVVAGDSLAAGLWSGLARMAENDLRLSVDGRYKEDSGLARPEIYDWPASLPKILAANPVDIVVMLVGNNDAQSIRAGDLRHAFGTPEWVAAYEAAIDRVNRALADAGVSVYWVSLPPMAQPKYDETVKQIHELQKLRIESSGLKMIDIRAALLGKDGLYAESAADETGEVRKLRARDGVHFLRPGNNRIGAIVLAAIKADIDAADGVTADGGKPEAAALPANDGPLFGQDAAAGAGNIVEAAPLKDVTAPALRLPPASPTGPLRIVSGSRAEQLYVKGETPPAPKGRFDDFSFAPAAE